MVRNLLRPVASHAAPTSDPIDEDDWDESRWDWQPAAEVPLSPQQHDERRHQQPKQKRHQQQQHHAPDLPSDVAFDGGAQRRTLGQAQNQHFHRSGTPLKLISEIDPDLRYLFPYRTFNAIQSHAFNTVAIFSLVILCPPHLPAPSHLLLSDRPFSPLRIPLMHETGIPLQR
jgi:hypothetical protein